MPAHSAPILPRKVIQQAQRIGKLIRAHKVAPLIGAGISRQCGLPSWNELVGRLITGTKSKEPSAAARSLPDDEYVALIQQTFETELEIASYLRRCWQDPLKPHRFGEAVNRALYASNV